ncbi:uncharacterized protein LOC6601582 [Drosophila persimilis]|uniref:uncharacterized protein LOC6601582 n=1 Tax=Drosophila persimilis TaxID=7234 RepID=UPI000F0905DE|nr:uncharacterized protein LOC6601582 [Drosophila persimilis]
MSKRVSIILPGEMELPPPPLPPPSPLPAKPKFRSKSNLKRPSISLLKTPGTLKITSSDLPTSQSTRTTQQTTSSDLPSTISTRSLPQRTSSDLPSTVSTSTAMQMTSSGRSSSSRNYFRDPTNTTTARMKTENRIASAVGSEEQEISQSDTSQIGWLSVRTSIKNFLENTIGVLGAGSATSIIKFLSHFRGDSHNPSRDSETTPAERSGHTSPKPEYLTLFRREKADSETEDLSSVRLDLDSSTGETDFCSSSQPSVISVKTPLRVEVLPKSSRKSLARVRRRSSSNSRRNLPSFAFALVSADETINSQEEAEPKTPKDTTDPSSATKGISEPPPSCATYDERCCCCHCVHMRRAVKQAEFLASDEGKRRLEMKMAAKDFFLDINAMSIVRERILCDLHGIGPKQPSPRVSYPLAITDARRMDAGSLALEWFVHDYSDIDHYEIYADNVLRRSIYNPQTIKTILLDIDVSTPHKLRMRPIPVQGRGTGARPEDKLVLQLREGGLDGVTAGTLCDCLKPKKTPNWECKSLVDFWTDSEFLYLPAQRTRS